MPAQGVLVIGLGYVGLPLAVQAARAGFRVTGYDTSAEITDGLMAGRSHVDDVTDAEVAAMLGQGFLVTSDEAGIGPQDVIVICVPTPLSVADGPDLSAVRAATATAGRLLRLGTLVSLESTTYPGTTEEVVRPLLEKASGLTAGIGFSLAFSPERIDPGNPEYGLRNTPKIVGGVTPSCADAAASFGAAVAYHDPYVTEWQVDGEAVPHAADLPAAVAAADLVILLQPHQGYDLAEIARTARLLLDTRGVAPAAPHVEAL